MKNFGGGMLFLVCILAGEVAVAHMKKPPLGGLSLIAPSTGEEMPAVEQPAGEQGHFLQKDTIHSESEHKLVNRSLQLTKIKAIEGQSSINLLKNTSDAAAAGTKKLVKEALKQAKVKLIKKESASVLKNATAKSGDLKQVLEIGREKIEKKKTQADTQTKANQKEDGALDQITALRLEQEKHKVDQQHHKEKQQSAAASKSKSKAESAATEKKQDKSEAVESGKQKHGATEAEKTIEVADRLHKEIDRLQMILEQHSKEEAGLLLSQARANQKVKALSQKAKAVESTKASAANPPEHHTSDAKSKINADSLLKAGNLTDIAGTNTTTNASAPAAPQRPEMTGRFIRFSVSFDGGTKLNSQKAGDKADTLARSDFKQALKMVIARAASLAPEEVAIRNLQPLKSGGFIVDAELWFPKSQAAAAGQLESTLYNRASDMLKNAPEFRQTTLYGLPTVSGIDVMAVPASLVEHSEELNRRRLRAEALQGFGPGGPGGAASKEQVLLPRVAHPNPQRRQHWGVVKTPGAIHVTTDKESGKVVRTV